MKNRWLLKKIKKNLMMVLFTKVYVGLRKPSQDQPRSEGRRGKEAE